jgi:hypothetical protein
MRGYDQFSYLPFYVLQILYVSYVYLYCFVCSHEIIQTVLSYRIMTFLKPIYAINIPYLSGTAIRGTPKTPNLSW